MTQAASFCAALQAGNHSAAIKLLDSAINAGPTEPLLKCSLHINRGVCNSRLQLYRKALKVGREISECEAPDVSPRAPSAHAPSLPCLQDFDAALECNPASVEAMYHKGVVLVALKKPQVRAVAARPPTGAFVLRHTLAPAHNVSDALSVLYFTGGGTSVAQRAGERGPLHRLASHRRASRSCPQPHRGEYHAASTQTHVARAHCGQSVPGAPARLRRMCEERGPRQPRHGTCACAVGPLHRCFTTLARTGTCGQL